MSHVNIIHVAIARKKIAIVTLFLASLFISTFLSVNHAYAAVNYLEAYKTMPTRLPDDSYPLLSKATGQPSGGQDCENPGGKPKCVAGSDGSGGSHQYITISGSEGINDANTARKDGYESISIVMYTRTPKDAKRLYFDFTTRKRNIDQTGDADCKTNLLVTYRSYKSFRSGQTSVDSPKDCGGIHSTDVIDPNVFDTEIRYRNPANPNDPSDTIGTGIYRAIVEIRVNKGVSRQASFHISANQGGFTLGYLSGVWQNMYPTLLADGNKLVFKWRPPCEANGTTQSVVFDEGDEGNRVIQGGDASMRIIRQKPGSYIPPGGGGRAQVAERQNVTAGTLNSAVETYDPPTNRQTYSYSAEFTNIDGGNGVGIQYPYDSGDFFLPCPEKSPDPQPPVAACDRIQYPMKANRNYRFTVFSKIPGSRDDTSFKTGNSDGNPNNSNGKDWASYNTNNQFYNGLQTASNTTSSDQNFTINFPSPKGPDWYVYVESWDRGGDNPQYRMTSEQVDNCYSATCDILSASGASGLLGAGRAKAGEQIDVSYRITNTGKQRLDSGSPLALSYSGNNHAVNPVPFGLNSGGSGEGTFAVTANSTRSTQTISVYPDMPGKMGLGVACPVNVAIYQRYDFSASVNATVNDPESPSRANFTSSISQQGVDVDGISTRSFYKYSGSGGGTSQLPMGPYNDARNFGSPTYNDTYVIPDNSYSNGDGWCTTISLDRGHGWRGPGDYINDGPAYASNCGDNGSPPPVTVVNKPYTRVYGGDVSAGGGFGSSCFRSDSKIMAFMRPISEQKPFDGTAQSNRSGSGGQLASFALGAITGFTSASTRGIPPVLPNGLTFSNTASYDQASLSPYLGGNLNGDGKCMPDYYQTTQFGDGDNKQKINNTDFNISTVQSEKQTVIDRNGAGSVTLTSAGTYSKRHTVYVNGDVFIRDPIQYVTNYTGSVNNIPNFTLVVKGNIYINSSIGQLDGTFIAQPNGTPNSGRIYTCAASATPITTGGGLYANCGANGDVDGNHKQLTVNGSLIAEKVVLNRTGYSLRDSRFREQANNSNAAEKIVFSPEVYLSPPVFRPVGTATSGDYDYLSIMAPIL